ncbi:MAG: hypothetical protein HQL57_08275 [Magnetococcales bacterium]|nr:hypothetical protein [Magnetococcales bacterium]MBF0157163.1 hypothetical protein [Magnetococcales bacterium]
MDSPVTKLLLANLVLALLAVAMVYWEGQSVASTAEKSRRCQVGLGKGRSTPPAT